MGWCYLEDRVLFDWMKDDVFFKGWEGDLD